MKIEFDAFQGCDSLKTIKIAGGENFKKVAEDILVNWIIAYTPKIVTFHKMR